MNHFQSTTCSITATAMWVQITAAVAVALAIGIPVFAMRWLGFDSPVFWMVAASSVVLIGTAAVKIYFMFGQPTTLSLTPTSVTRRQGSQFQEIPLERLAAVRTQMVDINLNGIYNMTYAKLECRNEADDAAIAIDANLTFGSPQYDSFNQLRDYLAAIVAQRMQGQLQRKGFVQWTPELEIQPNQLIWHHGGQAKPIAFDRITGCVETDGNFKIAIDNQTRPLFTIKNSQWNFYPGLELVSQLISGHASGSSEPKVHSTAGI